MPNFTKIPDSFREEYKKKFLLTDNQEIHKQAEEDPVVFAYYFLGKKLRLHQAFILDKVVKAMAKGEGIGARVASCWPDS